MFVMSQEGGLGLWKYMLKLLTPNNPTVHLLGTFYNPTHTSTLSNYAANELPETGGYSPQTLSNPGANWSFSDLAAGVQAQYITLSWMFTAALTVYGYYLSDDINLWSWGGELFSVGYVFPSGGGLFTFNLPLYLISCPGVSSC